MNNDTWRAYVDIGLLRTLFFFAADNVGNRLKFLELIAVFRLCHFLNKGGGRREKTNLAESGKN